MKPEVSLQQMTLTCLNQLRMHLLQHAAWLGALTTTIQQNIDEGLVSASDIYVTSSIVGRAPLH